MTLLARFSTAHYGSDNTPTLPELIKQYQVLTTGVINFELYNQMVHTHHSTAIEGSTLTLLEIQTLLEKGLTAGASRWNTT